MQINKFIKTFIKIQKPPLTTLTQCFLITFQKHRTNLERNSGFIFIYHLSYMLRLAFTDFSLQLLSHSFLHDSLHLFFHSLQQMPNRKHHRLIMHILQNVPVHQHLQTRREFVIGFPESQYNEKKRKQFQLISHIAFFQPDPMQPLAGFRQFCSLSIEFLSCILEKVTIICQISSPHRRETADMNPFVGGMTVFFGITQDIVDCHGFVVICIFFRLEFIHRPGDSSGDAVDPVFSS